MVCGSVEDKEITQSIEVAYPTPYSSVDPLTVDPNRGGIMRLANRGDPPASFDTLRTSSIALHHVGGGLFGSGNLVTRCRENMYLVCPYIARTWTTNSDFTEWIFTIRDDIQWHDGQALLAEDVKFWLTLAKFGLTAENKSRAPAYFRADLGDIESIETIEGNRLKILLKKRFPHYLDSLMNPRFKIAHPKHLMKERMEAGEVSLAPLEVGLIGSGPFLLDKYNKGGTTSIRKFDNYWERDREANSLPYLDGIDFITVPDPSAMDAALRTGRIDGGARGEGHYLSLERKQGYDMDLKENVFYAEMQGGLFRMAFNMLKPGPWEDVRVRRAISLYINREAAIPSALGGFGYISPTFGPSNPFTSSDFATWSKFNPAKLADNRTEASKLMKEAGYENGFSMGYLCRSRVAPRCEFLHSQLAGLNIDLNIQIVDEGEWNRGRVSLDYDSQPGAHFTPPLPEATESVFGVYSNNPDAYSKHEDKNVSKLYQSLKSASTQAQRVSIWEKIEAYIVDEQAYVVPIAGTIQVVPYLGHVKGLVIPPEDGHTHTDFATVWLNRP